MADENASSVSVARIRQVVLLIILALAVVALIFEFTVVRPKVFAAWDAVSELIETNYANPGQVTNTDKNVQEKIGRAPSRTTSKENRHVEIYEFRRGIPILVYAFRVEYDTQEDGTQLLSSAQAERLPSRSEKEAGG